MVEVAERMRERSPATRSTSPAATSFSSRSTKPRTVTRGVRRSWETV